MDLGAGFAVLTSASLEKRDDFLDVGFLLTDYASDFYDGKQLTLCVYI